MAWPSNTDRPNAGRTGESGAIHMPWRLNAAALAQGMVHAGQVIDYQLGRTTAPIAPRMVLGRYSL
jgi:hypothetical protein